MQENSLQALQAAATAGDAAAQYQLGNHLLKQGLVKAGFGWLHKAAEQDFVRALDMLGVLLLTGNGVQQNPDMAIQYFRRAAMIGDAQALYRCAEMIFSGVGSVADTAVAMDCLVTSAQQGYPFALRALGIMLQHDAKDLALTAFQLASYAGDALSQHSYALMLLPSNPAQAKFWFGQAADQGLFQAIRRYQAMADVEAEQPDEPELAPILRDFANQISELTAPSFAKHAIDTLSEEVKVGQVSDFFNSVECDYLIHTAGPYLQPARVVSEDAAISHHGHRTGETAALGNKHLDFGQAWLQQRIASLSDHPHAHAEPLAVIRYQSGEEYKLHGDYLPENSALTAADFGGQRVQTVLVYLNDDFVGGATHFPHLQLSVQPKAGYALIFSNTDSDHTPNTRSQHAGTPVESGEKWLASKWIRALPIQGR